MKNIVIFFTAVLCACAPAVKTGAPKPHIATPAPFGDCNNPLSYMVGTRDNCIKECPNRETNGAGGGTGMNYVINCALKECPSDRPLRAKNGSCY
jgi:hypothetical protein